MRVCVDLCVCVCVCVGECVSGSMIRVRVPLLLRMETITMLEGKKSIYTHDSADLGPSRVCRGAVRGRAIKLAERTPVVHKGPRGNGADPRAVHLQRATLLGHTFF
jgi:hypothetical protein